MTIHFHDVSNYQGDYHPTGPTIAKATEGTTYTDMRFATNRSRTLAGGWPFLGYHFHRHGNVPAQVDHNIAVMGHGQAAMLDIEKAGDGSYPTFDESIEFVDLYAQRSSGGRVSLGYIPEWFWRDYWHSPSLKPFADRGVGLISSYYVPYSDTGPGWDPYGGVAPVIWQYTSTPLDTNAFKGTQDQLGAVFAGGDDDMTPQQVQALANCEAVRAAWKANADTVWEYALDGTRKSMPMAPYWAAIAARAPQPVTGPVGPPGPQGPAGEVVDHTHTAKTVGATGPAIPLVTP